MAFVVDSAVPFGNVCGASVAVEGDEATVRFAADPHGGPECLWFCFRVRRTAAGCGRLRLVLDHFSNLLGGSDPSAVQPVVRYAGADWTRLDRGVAETLADGRLCAAWRMDAPASWVDVALCYPYGQDDVQALAAESGGCWRSDVIGVSQSGRPLVRLSNSPGEPGGSRPGLFLVARQHSGETPGSWVLDGLLRRLARDRSDALVWAVPLANADGVAQGDYGKDNFPYDLNRAWRPPPMRHETVVYERDIRRWSERCRPCLALDFHAPGACETEGVYAYLPKPEVFLRLHDESARWADALAEALAPRYAASPFRRVARYASRWETPSLCEFVAKVYRIPALALETPYSRCGATVLTREGYREVGASIADAVLRRLGEKP